MVVLQTEPVPLALLMVYSVLLMAAFFIVRLVVSGHFIKKILGERPIILLVGPPESGKKKLMDSFRKANVRTERYPFIGRFRTCDITLGKKRFRIISFHSMTDYHTLKKESIKMLGKRPRLIIFLLHRSSEMRDIEKQRSIFGELREMFYGVPAVAVVNRDDSTIKGVTYMKEAFRKNLVEVHLKKENMKSLENRMKKLLLG